jgi:hypothetical protein
MTRFIIGAGSTEFGEYSPEVVAAIGKGGDDVAREIIERAIQNRSSIQAGKMRRQPLPEERTPERKSRGRADATPRRYHTSTMEDLRKYRNGTATFVIKIKQGELS